MNKQLLKNIGKLLIMIGILCMILFAIFMKKKIDAKNNKLVVDRDVINRTSDINTCKTRTAADIQKEIGNCSGKSKQTCINRINNKCTQESLNSYNYTISNAPQNRARYEKEEKSNKKMAMIFLGPFLGPLIIGIILVALN
jgi:hypothetical protein